MFEPRNLVFNTPVRVLNRTVVGSEEVYVDAENPVDFCNWKGRGGTENTKTDSLVIEDTADVTMWFRPDIVAKGRLYLNDDPSQAYDVLNAENIEMRSHYMVLKVIRAVI